MSSSRPSPSAAPTTVTRPWRGVSAEQRISERRQRLLDAGLELFGTRGIANVNVEQVCAEAGLTKRYFYESFGSIDELIEAVLESAVGRLSAIVVPVLVEQGPFNLRPAVTALAEAVLADARLVRLLVVETYSGALANHRERLIDQAIDIWSGMASSRLAGPIDPLRVRFLAYGVVGALGELTAAWLDGRLDLQPSELAAWALDVYDTLATPALSDFLLAQKPPTVG